MLQVTGCEVQRYTLQVAGYEVQGRAATPSHPPEAPVERDARRGVGDAVGAPRRAVLDARAVAAGCAEHVGGAGGEGDGAFDGGHDVGRVDEHHDERARVDPLACRPQVSSYELQARSYTSYELRATSYELHSPESSSSAGSPSEKEGEVGDKGPQPVPRRRRRHRGSRPRSGRRAAGSRVWAGGGSRRSRR